METITAFIRAAQGFLWDHLLIVLLCGTGLFFTITLKGVQFRRFGAGLRQMFSGFSLRGKKAGKHGMSSFQAVTTAIAGQVGTRQSGRGRHRHCPGRPGGHPVDVGGRSAGDGHSVRRGPSRPEIQNR